MRKKYIIFDFDGTLVDSKYTFANCWNQVAREYGFKEMKHDQLEALKKLSIRERSKLLGFPLVKLPLVIPRLYKLYRESIHEVELFPGIKEMLEDLNSNGYKLAIISSNSQENISSYLREHDIHSVTTILCSSSIFGKDKLINRFLRENKLYPSDVLYVGDEYRDIVACKKAGVEVIWVSWGFDSFEVIHSAQPNFLANSPEDILRLIKE